LYAGIKSLRLPAPEVQIPHFLHFYFFINSRSYKIDWFFAILITDLRGEDSGLDEEFVQEMALYLGNPYQIRQSRFSVLRQTKPH
jgi:hypothetical protein